MAWLTPVTVTNGDVFTAALFNTYVRDNQLEFAAAKATGFGGENTMSRWFVTDFNEVVQRNIESVIDAGTQDVATVSYTGLGSTISMQTGASALCMYSAAILPPGGEAALVSIEVSGASSVAASDAWAIGCQGVGVNNLTRTGRAHIVPLNPGVNNFQLAYRTTGGTASFHSRQLIVWAF